MPKSVAWETAIHQRLARQHLGRPVSRVKLSALVSDLCGVQAQVMAAAELALAARVKGLTQTTLRKLIWEERVLVKTYGPRGTLHLLPADELPLWMAAMRAREHQQEIGHEVGQGYTSAQAHAVVESVGNALDGRTLTREQLAEDVGKRLGQWAREGLSSSWGVLLGPAAHAGLLCFGPSEGAKVTFVRADQWIKGWKKLDEEKALRHIALRYVAAYGPVRSTDFARWFWVSKETAERLFAELASKLTQVDFEGQDYWAAKAPIIRGIKSEKPLYLLPEYDTYTLGCVPRERLILDESVRRRIFAFGRGRFEGPVGLPVLLFNGQVAGLWARKAATKKLTIRIEALLKLNRTQKAHLETEAERIAAFYEKPLELSFATLS